MPDPLAEPELCRCGGYGWVTVQDYWVEKAMAAQAAEVEKRREAFAAGTGGEVDPDDGYEVWMAQRRAALAQSVYPCRACNARRFFRWAKGCWWEGHDRSECDLCQKEAEETTPRRRRR